MAMTALEKAAKFEIEEILNKQGYPTYSKLFDKFDLNLTEDPNVIGYMEIDKARIVLNKNLNINQVSTIVRHEILHEYLTHGARNAKLRSSNPSKYKNIPHDVTNIAADYEISNLGYTEEDKTIIRNILLNDKVLKGLVTEDDHPDWGNKSFEEMLDLLSDEYEEIKDTIEIKLKEMGSRGDPNIQEAEQLEREASALEDQLEDEGNSSAADKASQLSDKAEEAAEGIEDLKSSKRGRVFDSDNEQKKKKALKDRVDDIKKALEELKEKNDLEYEISSVKAKERLAKQAMDLKKYNSSPLAKFRESLNAFIKNQISTGRGNTWSRFNKKYANTNLIRPGTSRSAPTQIPLINVYFDRSGSFSAYPEKTKQAEQIISQLNEYVRQGKIKVKLYYASDDVYSDRFEAESHGSGMDSDPVIEHIRRTNPTNVIVLTDADANYGRDRYEVPGAVWHLFFNSEAPSFEERLKGKQLTRSFLI